MKWHRARQTEQHRAPEANTQPTSLDEAKAARQHSEAELDAVRQRDPAIRRLTESLREHRRTNHFAGMLEVIFKGDG